MDFDHDKSAELSNARKEYQLTAWWTVEYGARKTIEADSPEAAMAELKRLVEEDDFICNNQSFDDSDGPTNLTVYEYPAFEVVAEELHPSAKLAGAAPGLLAAAELVMARWQSGDLAEAVRALAAAVAEAKSP